MWNWMSSHWYVEANWKVHTLNRLMKRQNHSIWHTHRHQGLPKINKYKLSNVVWFDEERKWTCTKKSLLRASCHSECLFCGDTFV